MLILAMDTAYKYLSLGIYRDDTLLAGFSEPAFKKQSERIFPELQKLLESLGLQYRDLEAIVVTEGPGSYTGVRIAMTIAKTLAFSLDIPLYTINTLQLYAGKNSGLVLLDARAKRAFFGRVTDGKLVEQGIAPLEELAGRFADVPVVFGDQLLGGKEAGQSDFLVNFPATREFWKRVEDIHGLTPLYLKDFA